MDVHQLLGILGFSLVLWWMYKGFLKQPTSYNDYIDRATLYDAVLLNKTPMRKFFSPPKHENNRS
ncbi:hypothetical protein E5Z46_00480 [Geobacillus kaustophilus NBRC 102445]|uniref:hypothetical protein n=1 Tax=Geobacillus thermoleovorans group TaxID=1505648 RepID=UPI0010BF5B44|nr:hypothetical protein [Geobacillus kaustophilus]MED4971667.1 hypothetical protein [Geobacillus thermoleovorans]QCK80983.1 hypothetical protein E5Z46_00480 [Geobacillus kaustophilus NBRC 102445]